VPLAFVRAEGCFPLHDQTCGAEQSRLTRRWGR
jgi:hypothetical protein